jgi:hypothetical protein
MRRASILVVLSALLMTIPGTAAAQGFFTPFVGYNFGGDSVNCASLRSCDDRRLNIGMAFGSTRRFAGTEQDLSYVPHFFGDTPEGGGSMLTAMSNFLLIAPAGPVRPYGVLGLGLIRAHASASGTKNSLGYDIGGGVNVFFGKRFGLRADVRRFRSMQNVTLLVLDGEKLEFWRASLGVTFR